MDKCNHKWEWQMDADLTSWIRCKKCDTNMFDDGVGVILISWKHTDISHINIKDVLTSNVHNNGVINKGD